LYKVPFVLHYFTIDINHTNLGIDWNFTLNKDMSGTQFDPSIVKVFIEKVLEENVIGKPI
jgi:hypothetical protein